MEPNVYYILPGNSKVLWVKAVLSLWKNTFWAKLQVPSWTFTRCRFLRVVLVRVLVNNSGFYLWNQRVIIYQQATRRCSEKKLFYIHEKILFWVKLQVHIWTFTRCRLLRVVLVRFLVNNWMLQKQPPRGVPRKRALKICSKFTGEHPCQNVISIKLLWNFVKITLRHGCAPVNLLHIFRTAVPKNTSGRLLLMAAFVGI